MISHSVDAAMTQTHLYIFYKYVDLKKQKQNNNQQIPFNPVCVILNYMLMSSVIATFQFCFVNVCNLSPAGFRRKGNVFM